MQGTFGAEMISPKKSTANNKPKVPALKLGQK
jgi:hypothetical protein